MSPLPPIFLSPRPPQRFSFSFCLFSESSQPCLAPPCCFFRLKPFLASQTSAQGHLDYCCEIFPVRSQEPIYHWPLRQTRSGQVPTCWERLLCFLLSAPGTMGSFVRSPTSQIGDGTPSFMRFGLPRSGVVASQTGLSGSAPVGRLPQRGLPPPKER